MARTWSGDGHTFSIDWGGAPWTLLTDADRPGLYDRDGHGPILGLAGLAARGRRHDSALAAASLTQVERHFGRIEATYTPDGWGEATIRAAWFPRDDDAIDLEVQISARSVGDLKGAEVQVLCALAAHAGAGPLRRVLPRDRRAAGLSYDGREPDLHDLATDPVPRPGVPAGTWLLRSLPDPAHTPLAVLARPEDVARLILDPAGPARFALFGHDLERGVVLRGRLRALRPAPAVGEPAAIDARFRAYCAEPPPLTT